MCAIRRVAQFVDKTEEKGKFATAKQLPSSHHRKWQQHNEASGYELCRP